MSKFIAERMRRKLAAMSIILVPALAISVVFAGLLYFTLPLLPPAWRDGLLLLRSTVSSTNPDEVRTFIGSFGLNVQAAFFTLQLLQVLLAPIPGHLLGFLGGYLFGFWQGLALSMAAMTVGSALVMGAGRLVGQQIARRFVPPALMARFDQQTLEQSGVTSFFMIFLLPVFPDDAICFIAGLTRLSIPRLMLAAIIGRIPGLAVLTYTGASLNGHLLWGQIVFGISIVAALLVWFFEEELLAMFKKL